MQVLSQEEIKKILDGAKKNGNAKPFDPINDIESLLFGVDAGELALDPKLRECVIGKQKENQNDRGIN